MDNGWKYYAGTFGYGELTIAKVKVEFRPTIGPQGAYRFTEVDKIFFGGRKLLRGLHITLDDAEAGLCDDLQSAKKCMVEMLEDKIAELQTQIVRFERIKMQIIWIEEV